MFESLNLNIIDIKTERPKVLETTALGVALFAGYQIGVFKSLEQIKRKWKKDKINEYRYWTLISNY